mgnify:CR=1 FL=1
MALNFGADDYITKPFNIKIVLKKIQVVLDRGNQNRENRLWMRFTLSLFPFTTSLNLYNLESIFDSKVSLFILSFSYLSLTKMSKLETNIIALNKESSKFMECIEKAKEIAKKFVGEDKVQEITLSGKSENTNMITYDWIAKINNGFWKYYLLLVQKQLFLFSLILPNWSFHHSYQLIIDLEYFLILHYNHVIVLNCSNLLGYITKKEKKGLTGENVNEEKAKEIAKKFVGEDKVQEITLLGIRDSNPGPID